MGWGEADFQQLAELERKIQDLEVRKVTFFHKTTNELAQRLIRKVTQKTPVGSAPDVDAETKSGYWSGYQGGTLRKNWKANPMTSQGGEYSVEVFNPIEYASYVEYGHRQSVGRFVPALGKRLVSPWVEGRHMLTSSETELNAIAPSIIERNFKEYLGKW